MHHFHFFAGRHHHHRNCGKCGANKLSPKKCHAHLACANPIKLNRRRAVLLPISVNLTKDSACSILACGSSCFTACCMAVRNKGWSSAIIILLANCIRFSASLSQLSAEVWPAIMAPSSQIYETRKAASRPFLIYDFGDYPIKVSTTEGSGQGG